MKRTIRFAAVVCLFAACTQEDAVIRVQDADALYLDVLTASSSMTLSTSWAKPGTKVTARVTFKNTSSRKLWLPRIEVASTGGAFSPAKTNVSLGGYSSVTLYAERTISGSDPAGTWDVYPRVTGSDGVARKYLGRKLTVSGTTSTGSGEVVAIGPRVVVSQALSISQTGSTLTGSITYTNTGDRAASLQNVQITARRPGATNGGGPYDTLSPMHATLSLAAGASITLNASRAMTSADPSGQWYAYATYQDVTGWHDGAPVYFSHATAAPLPASGRWLSTRGNKIYGPDGAVWQGRGVNIADTRGCGACVGSTANADEVIRRINEAVDNWKVDFIRLDLESYAGTTTNSQSVTVDPAYLADVVKIVKHIGTKPNVYVLLSLWVDPTFSALGWPTTQTQSTWRKLAQTFKDDGHVLFGLVNEPQSNFDGAQDAAVWSAMNATVAAIREVEAQNGTPQHLISVQGTAAWARRLGYYVTHPITAGGGTHIAYETHVYDPTAQFDSLFVQPSKTLPVIIGEFGPLNMTLTDTANLMQKADELEIPYLAWTFHMRCPPNLIVDNSNHSCGVNMALQPTEWGQQLKSHLSR